MPEEGARSAEATAALAPWLSGDYVRRWLDEDALSESLQLPRRLAVGIVGDAGIPLGTVVDLGAGQGSFLREFLSAFPQAAGVWVDASEPMQQEAGERLRPFEGRVRYVLGNVEQPDALGLPEAHVIVTSRVLHHFERDTLLKIYRVAFGVLHPGSFLFNLDHFGTPAGWEARYRRLRPLFTRTPRKRATHPHPVPFRSIDEHVAMLEEAGFEAPDVPWRLFFTALVAARKPA
jgi:hypothetical protein